MKAKSRKPKGDGRNRGGANIEHPTSNAEYRNELAAKERRDRKGGKGHPEGGHGVDRPTYGRKVKPQMNTDERRSDFNTKARSERPKVGVPMPHRSKVRIEERPPRTVGGIVLPPEERFFTKPELAKVMKVSVRCITDMMRRGEIRYLKINGHLVRFRLQDVNQRLSETVLFCESEGVRRTEDGGPKTGKREGGHGGVSTRAMSPT